MLFTKINCRGISTFFLISTIMIYGFDVSQAFAGKKHRTFKNTDVVSANDFHVNKAGGQIKTAANKRIASGNKSFPDKVFALPVDSFDWLTADLIAMEDILANGKLLVCTTGGSARNTSFFTLNGNPIATKSVITLKKYLLLSSATPGSIVAKITNDNAEGVEISNFKIFIDSTGDLSIPGEFVPDGTLVAGIPSSFTLAPGETQKFLLSGLDSNLIVSMSNDVALSSAPADLFFELDAELVSDIITVPIPTVSTWGIAAMVLLVMVTGTIVFRRKTPLNMA